MLKVEPIEVRQFLRGFADYGGNPREIQRSIEDEAAEAILRQLEVVVRGDLSAGTAEKYLSAVRGPDRTPQGAVIRLTDEGVDAEGNPIGPFPRWLEGGKGPYSMNQGKDVTVSFSHNAYVSGTGQAWMRPSRFPLASLQATRAGRRVAAAAAAGLPGSQREPHILTVRRLAQGLILSRTGGDVRAGAKGEGVRERQPWRQLDRRRQWSSANTFTTFRNRPSYFVPPSEDGGDGEINPDAWIHPGFTARHYFRRALVASREGVQAIITKYTQISSGGA